MNLTIITNNHSRELLCLAELTSKEKEIFDYVQEIYDSRFFRYRGCVYDAYDMMRAPAEFRDWDGYLNDTYFSGIVVRYVDDGERVIAGRFYS